VGTALSVTGVIRAAYTAFSGLVEPKGSAYTADERAQMRAMAIWNFGNAAVADETNRTGNNARALQGVTYPDNLPVLEFLSTDSMRSMPNWLRQHEVQLRNVQHHAIVVLEGWHYLHWTQSKAMAGKIVTFLDANLTGPRERCSASP
jgi:hypothetical protein